MASKSFWKSATLLPVVLFLLLSLWLPGCSTYEKIDYFSKDLINQSYQLADQLIQNMEEIAVQSTHMPIGKDEPIIAATFVDVTTLEPDSTFGRIVSDQVAARFVQKGYHLSEAKLRKDGLSIHEGMGEVLLSRKLQEIAQSFAAAYVILGTYAIGTQSIFLNAKVITVSSGRIIASGNREILINDTLLDLLQKDKTMPIKQLTDGTMAP